MGGEVATILDQVTRELAHALVVVQLVDAAKGLQGLEDTSGVLRRTHCQVNNKRA